jgi:uncharacterized membrane protein YphA (DoxX/SURF4 family)
MTPSVTAAPSALFLLSGSAKLCGLQRSHAMRAHIGVGPATWRAIGVAEVGAAASLLLGERHAWLGRVGSGCLTMISVGAIATHVRVGDRPRGAMPAVAALALCVPALRASLRR